MPNSIGPDGKYTAALMFTTKAYRDEAFRLVLQEANRVATELRLPEKLPITETDLVTRFISSFGYAHAKQAIGNVTTRNYTYYISEGNKFIGGCKAVMHPRLIAVGLRASSSEQASRSGAYVVELRTSTADRVCGALGMLLGGGLFFYVLWPLRYNFRHQ